MSTPRTDAVKCSLEEVVRRFTNAAMPTQTLVDGMMLCPADEMATLETELQQARREMEELKRDKERLDWFDDNYISSETFLRLHGETSIRKAIDRERNAMKEEK